MHSLHMSFHLAVGVGVTSESLPDPDILYSIARHDCSYNVLCSYNKMYRNTMLNLHSLYVSSYV